MSNLEIVVQGADVSPDRFLLDGVDTSSKGPRMSVSLFGSLFFDRTAPWVRWLEREHRFVINGDPRCPHFENAKRMQDVHKDGETVRRQVEYKDSWIEDGVCTKCGGTQIVGSRTSNGSRSYTLGEVELMIHALAGNESIDGAQASDALTLVKTLARIHGLLI